MRNQSKTKAVIQKIQTLERKLSLFAICLTPARLFAKNRHGVSAVISNLILIGAVLTMGLVALAYARSTSIDYQTNYAKTVDSGITKLNESLVFEYAIYGTNNLAVYVMNSGSVDVTISSVSINKSPVSLSHVSIHRMSDNQQVTNFVIGKGVAVKISVQDTSASHAGENVIKITSRSNSNFAYNFMA